MDFKIQKLFTIPAIKAAVATIPQRCFLASVHVFKVLMEDTWFGNGQAYNSQGDKVDLQKGQRVISIRPFAKETRISERQLRTSLIKLEGCGLITRKSTRRHTIITLIYYNLYHDTIGKKRKSDTAISERKSRILDEIEHTPHHPRKVVTQRHINNYKKEYLRYTSLLPDNKSYKSDGKGFSQSDFKKEQKNVPSYAKHYVNPAIPRHKSREVTEALKGISLNYDRHREDLLNRLLKINPKLNKRLTMAYIIQSAREPKIKSRKGYLYDMLIKPFWMPKDDHQDNANKELATIRKRKNKKQKTPKPQTTEELKNILMNYGKETLYKVGVRS